MSRFQKRFLMLLEDSLAQKKVSLLGALRLMRRGLKAQWKDQATQKVQDWYEQQLEQNALALVVQPSIGTQIHQVLTQAKVPWESMEAYKNGQTAVQALKTTCLQKEGPEDRAGTRLGATYQQYLYRDLQWSAQWPYFLWGWLDGLLSSLDNKVAPEVAQEILWLGQLLAPKISNGALEIDLQPHLTQEAQAHLQQYLKQQEVAPAVRQQFIEQDFQDFDGVYRALS